MKEQQIRFSLIVLLLGSSILSCARQCITQDETETFHNVIVLVPDGCGVAHMTAARWYKGAPLAQDSMEVGLVRTFSANSIATMSAAAATAFATGHKTWEDSKKVQCLSMRPDSLILPEPQELPASEQWRPVATVLEGARLAGKAVGLVATSYISHATPAAFASHWHSRDHNNIIMEQIVYQGVDVVFGGGFRYLIESDSQIPLSTQKGTRRDGEDLRKVLLSRGYDLITTREELYRLDSDAKKVWGIFASGHMEFDIDRRMFAPAQPSLSEMTEKAIEILSKGPGGFFLLVEGSQIDWASHDNDPVGMLTDYLAFDNAVRIAHEFAISHPGQRTLVLVFPDHDCGGMAIGNRDVDYRTCRPERMVGVVKKANLTAEGVATLMRDSIYGISAEKIQEMMARHYGIDDLTPEELKSIEDELADTVYGSVNDMIGPMLSKRAGIGWTTFGHTGNDVPMYSFGLDRPENPIDNTEIAHLCAKALGFRLGDINEQLFADAELLFDGAAVTIDTFGVEKSMGQLIVERGEKKALFPFFKNIMVIRGDTISLEGLTVYSLKAHRVFLPAQAKRLFDTF